MKQTSKTIAQDRQKEASVIYMGNIAKHLPKDDVPKISAIVDALIGLSSTPSESVQRVCFLI